MKKYIIIDLGIKCIKKDYNNIFTLLFWIIYCKIKGYKYIIKE